MNTVFISKMIIACGKFTPQVKVLRTIPLMDILFCVHYAYENEDILVVSEFTTGVSIIRGEMNMTEIIKGAQDILSTRSYEQIKNAISFHKVINSINGPLPLQRAIKQSIINDYDLPF